MARCRKCVPVCTESRSLTRLYRYSWGWWGTFRFRTEPANLEHSFQSTTQSTREHQSTSNGREQQSNRAPERCTHLSSRVPPRAQEHCPEFQGTAQCTGQSTGQTPPRAPQEHRSTGASEHPDRAPRHRISRGTDAWSMRPPQLSHRIQLSPA